MTSPPNHELVLEVQALKELGCQVRDTITWSTKGCPALAGETIYRKKHYASNARWKRRNLWHLRRDEVDQIKAVRDGERETKDAFPISVAARKCKTTEPVVRDLIKKQKVSPFIAPWKQPNGKVRDVYHVVLAELREALRERRAKQPPPTSPPKSDLRMTTQEVMDQTGWSQGKVNRLDRAKQFNSKWSRRWNGKRYYNVRTHSRAKVEALQAKEEKIAETPDELTQAEAAERYEKAASTIRRYLRDYAPSAGRKVKRLTRTGIRSATVYPVEAIEAALRGEKWTPPAEDGNGDDTTPPDPAEQSPAELPMPAAARTTPPEPTAAEQAPGDTPPTDSNPPRKGGTAWRWAKLRETILRAIGDDPSVQNPRIMADYNRAWAGKRVHVAGKQRTLPKADLKTVRKIRAKLLAKSD